MMFQLQALDTLVFRTANPFDAGVNFHASSQFPPLPSVYAGALRQGKIIQDRNITIGFSGIQIKEHNNLEDFVFPQPLDTIITKEATNEVGINELTTMKIVQRATSNHELAWMLAPRQPIKKKVSVSGGAYLKRTQLQHYLNGCIENEYVKLGDYFTRESHIGIEMEQGTHATKKGMWYSTELIRPTHCSLVVEAKGTEAAEGDVVKLGGYAKLAKLKTIESFKITAPHNHSAYFKLYFATPAVFQHGWLPRWIDKDSKIGTFSYKKNKVKVQLLAAAIGKPVATGGYSNGPRPLRMAIPAGSVYYFKLLEGTYDHVIKLFHQKCMSDYREGLDFEAKWWDRLIYCDRGFGYTFVGKLEEDIEI